MFLQKPPAIGEQALNKIATVALQSQFQQAKTFHVQVKTDPNLLAQGRLEALSMEGTGLVLPNHLPVQEMQIKMGRIGVSPFKALMGNIQLTEPSHGTARFSLTDAQVRTAFQEQLSVRLRKATDVDLKTLKTQQIDCYIFARGEIVVNFQFKGQHFAIASRLHKAQIEGGISLESIRYLQGSEPTPALTQIIINSLEAALNVQQFELPGLSLKLRQFQIEDGKIILQATAKMTEFPKN
ncbi:MAG: DUF2993 domain-containing protein [Jaaginema sp. PMC 1079.18]|nr:DUF2993 domain-containing protein [Jaaginema sp. PMC 1080.18]MEC4854018.1 DUF2993 domain-containing protein [Jaaginema sp. PMC 1079.18]MEC4868045.1 DUF2993 domain-containing protein [Jaaginema sp. PMC 1078.18]